MDKQFWHQKWEDNQIAFHEHETNPLLLKHVNLLPLQLNSRVFVPLCGKTLDIAWLLSKGYKVIGVELVEMAIRQLFEELGVAPEIVEVGELKLYRAQNIDIFVGDIFNLSSSELGPIDAIYDRAAFVALPEAMRKNYVTHVAEITNCATQLLITYEYDQNIMSGPPFSTTQLEVTECYCNNYELTLLTSEAVQGGLKGHPAIEYVWLLKNHTSLKA